MAFTDLHEIACEFGELSGLAGGVWGRAYAAPAVQLHEQSKAAKRDKYARLYAHPQFRAAEAARTANYIKDRRARDPEFAAARRDYQREYMRKRRAALKGKAA